MGAPFGIWETPYSTLAFVTGILGGKGVLRSAKEATNERWTTGTGEGAVSDLQAGC